MLTIFRTPLVRQLAGVAAVLAALILAISGVYLAGVSAGKAKIAPDRDAWRTTAGQYLASATAWERSFRGSEARRDEERDQARDAVDEAAKACDARVATARRSAAAIQSIVTKEVRYDENRCPVRGVVGAGELRDALGLAAAGR